MTRRRFRQGGRSPRRRLPRNAARRNRRSPQLQLQGSPRRPDLLIFPNTLSFLPSLLHTHPLSPRLVHSLSVHAGGCPTCRVGPRQRVATHSGGPPGDPAEHLGRVEVRPRRVLCQNERRETSNVR